jgi:hypothetical protein
VSQFHYDVFRKDKRSLHGISCRTRDNIDIKKKNKKKLQIALEVFHKSDNIMPVMWQEKVFMVCKVTSVPVAVRSKAAGLLVGSNPTGVVDTCRECCVLSGRGLCDELIARPEESY